MCLNENFDKSMQLLETIQIKNAELQNVDFHNQRFNSSRREFFNVKEYLHLENLIKIPYQYAEGIFRCRVIYEKDIEEVTFIPYVYKEIKALKLVDIGNWDYSHKYADRSFMNNLLAENQDFDEVIMVKNGFVTDCTIANLAFWDGSNWFTSSTPLLKGTKRQQLLDRQKIIETEIRIEDISRYEGMCLINCFRNLELANLVRLNSDLSD